MPLHREWDPQRSGESYKGEETEEGFSSFDKCGRREKAPKYRLNVCIFRDQGKT